ncbi:MAG TPA: protease inhibitor I42 family protein [Gammaproteobacteria bacterium]|nr:protease inhibitor I42 family protein [Gammaproteobacteria bacterium]
MKLKLCLLSLLCAFSVTSWSAVPPPTVFTADKPNITVSATQPTFSLKLKANPSTGFLWFLRDYDASLVTPVSRQYEKPDGKLMGAPGYDIWTFKMKPAAFVVPRQTTLRMIYTRPFSNENPTPVLFSISTVD